MIVTSKEGLIVENVYRITYYDPDDGSMGVSHLDSGKARIMIMAMTAAGFEIVDVSVMMTDELARLIADALAEAANDD